ncbi:MULTISPECIES: DUF1493 family protein [Pectobacteriaceae]|nr:MULTISPECIES: DUF1493 family protein [Pectobacteriaceae]MEE3644451.1 DUF1493 family protein [Brenneria sp. L3_3C_1]MEE3652013.1 DUF1493 family protein [Brenneria sp. HEZEL_4_2_4]MEE3663641.1 DUF1493 family protein [Brenneria sp. g21c3]MBJ7223209.1 DUF1493 family protein [Brenneria sp. L3-3C-1]MDX5628579.1 DUF1493 family protein [Brenneria sp. L3-3Z]
MSIERRVIELIKKYDGHIFFAKRFLVITPDTDLKRNVKLASEDAIALLTEYVESFGISTQDISFTDYFPNEKGLFEAFTPKAPPKPLTVGMLIESAKEGRWLYD